MSNIRTTTTTYKAELEYESTNALGHTVQIDMYGADKAKHQSPTELLLSATAACSAVDVIQILRKKKKTIDGLQVVAEGTRREQHPRHFTDILLTFKLSSPDTSIEELEKVVALSVDKYCSVAATIRGVAKVRYQSEVIGTVEQ
jgi:putative redox protein